MRYYTKVNCQFDGRIYKAGSFLEYNGEVVPCPVCNGKDKKCPKCKGTGRSVPPHHFTPFHPEEEQKKVEEKQKSDEAEIDVIRAEMDEIGCGYDRRWKLPRLKDALIAFKKEKGL